MKNLTMIVLLMLACLGANAATNGSIIYERNDPWLSCFYYPIPGHYVIWVVQSIDTGEEFTLGGWNLDGGWMRLDIEMNQPAQSIHIEDYGEVVFP